MRTKTVITPYLLILPALATLLLLFVYPILLNGYLSIHDVKFATFNRAWPVAGLENYQALLKDSIFPFKFYKSLWVSLQFVGGSVLGQFVLGLALALALNARIRGRGLFRVLIAFPWILSELVVAYIWLYLYQPAGAINNLLSAAGLPAVRWLGSPGIAIWALVLTNIWFGTPFTMLMMGAALTTINPEVTEAATVDGANRRQLFRWITWPLIAPFGALNLILITMWTANLFALPLAMTKGGPVYATTTTSLYMYRYAFEFGNFSLGSSIGVMLFVFNVVAAAIYLRTLGGQ
ncbi:MAG: sugar ABC transporter permease [Ardenticatenaceae bacterium]|nr:sugar ABC transporter permease [Ardenticatenaceae bacterium]